MDILPVVASKSVAVNDAAPFVEPSATAFAIDIAGVVPPLEAIGEVPETEETYVVVSTDKVPLLEPVLTKPFDVKFDIAGEFIAVENLPSPVTSNALPGVAVPTPRFPALIKVLPLDGEKI